MSVGKLVATSLVAASAVDLTWSDCGDAATHGTVTNLQPTALNLGSNQLKATGILDKDEDGGTFEFVAKAGPITVLKGSGNLCEDTTINLPLGAGSIVLHGIACPAKAGALEIDLDINLASSEEVSNDLVKISLSGVSTSGDKLLCMNLGIASLAVASFEETVEKVNSGNHAWKAEVPSKFANVDEVKNYLGAFLPGDEKYQEEPVMEVEVSNGLPDSFDSATNWPQCSVIGNVRDQSSCGSCWAFGSVGSFEARACISTGNDVKYSPEQTAFCQGIFGAGNGCQGGNSAWGFFKNTGVVTGGDYPDKDTGATCSSYSLPPCAHHVPASAEYPACPSAEYPNPRCPKTCESSYAGEFDSDKLHASKTYSVRGEQQIMTQLVNNGPMYVAFNVFDDFPTYKSGVYHKTSNKMLGGHAVTMVGYGELDGEKYWKIKNSWNEQWGNGGHFLIRRGTNECGIEASVGAGDISASEVV